MKGDLKMTDEEMKKISEAIDGNEYAFEILMKPHVKNAKKTAYLLLHDFSLAEDAVQDALLQIHNSLYRFKPEMATLKTWFNGIVINCALKIARKRRFWSKLNNDASDPETPEKKTILNEESALIFECVKKLSLKLKTVIILHYYQDLSIEEIGITLGLSEGTIKSRLHNARKKLKKIMIENQKGIHTWEVEAWSKN